MIVWLFGFLLSTLGRVCHNPLILESPIVHIDETRSDKGASVQDVMMTDPTQTIGSDQMPLGSKEGELQFKHYPKFYERKKKKIEELTKVIDKELDATEKAPSTEEEIVESLNSSNSETVIKDSGDNDEWPIAIRKGTRSCVKPLSYDIANYLDYQQVSPSYKCFLTAIQNIKTPKNTEEVLENPNWKQAMDDEMLALIQNQTWELVDLPGGKKPVGCRWVYTIKYNSDGSLERYKARLVARGYTQTYGLDYKETFAPVAKMNTVRVLISIAVNLDWELLQYDIKNAFLYGDLKEEIYMQMPPGYENEATQGKVCRLKRSIYGLKQSPRAWFGKFSQVLKSLGYRQCNGDHTLFFRHFPQGGVVLLIVYVDDIIITGNLTIEINELESQLSKQFAVKNLGPLKYFLGIEFARSSKGIVMTQHKYILELLEQTKHLHSRTNDTPIESNHKLTITKDDPRVEISSYQKLVGKLLYLPILDLIFHMQ